jgi:signal transduction histidine kinase
LTAIKINLQSQAMFGEHPPTELETENIRIVEDAIQQVRRLALALRPSVLDDLGLIPALRWMTEQSAQRTGLVVAFDSNLDDVRFAPETETACFRVAQEAVTNIVRYAHAHDVIIRLQQDGDMLVMRVEDDGCGFDVADMRQRALAGASMGVLGMQERATLVGGTLDIQSAPGQGCIISLRCPWQLPQEVE